jgi:diaminopimelate decarboxylase
MTGALPPAVPPSVAAALAGAARPVCAYVHDPAVLRERAAALRAALPAGTAVCYAVKANGHPAVVATLAAATDGLEVASGGELDLATAALAAAQAAAPPRPGGAAPLLLFAGPAKTDAELAAAVAAGAVVNVESVLELRRLALVAAAPGARRPVRACLRVNRAGAAPAGSHRMTGVPTPFGLDEAQLPAAVAAAGPHVELCGFHLHAVSNNLDAAGHAAFVADAVAWAVAAAHRHRVPLRLVNVGGGLGVDHTAPPGADLDPGGAGFDLGALRRGLSGLTVPAGARLVVEPGRWLATPAGWYAAEVLDLKRTHGRWFAVLRGGTHHFRLPAAWGYSHPFTVLPVQRWPYPFDRPEVRDVAVDAVGELCTPRDVLTRAQPVARLRVGDVAVFANAGGYGWDISHHDFLRHPHPQFLLARPVAG